MRGLSLFSTIVVWLVLGIPSLGQASGDAKDAELKMLRETVKRNAEGTKPLRDRIAALERQLAQQKTDAAAVEKALDRKVVQLKEELDAEKAKTRAAEGELAKWKPRPPALDKDGAEVITPKRLEVMGEKYKGKTVEMMAVRFADLSDSFVDEVPGVQISSNGLVSRINVREKEKWVNFAVRGEDNGLHMKFFASKADWAEFLLTIKSGESLNLKGVAIDLVGTTDYGLICTQIERVAPNAPKKSRERE